MANFESRIECVKRNLNFLQSVNEHSNEYWDWQVTISFYVSVHLVNAHLDKKADLHYKTHDKVDLALNFANKLSPCRLSEANYLSFRKLRNLSRHSRYLINDDPKNTEDGRGYLTYDRHLTKAIKALDDLMKYVNSEYHEDLPKMEIKCEGLSETLTYFSKKSYH